MNQEEEQLIIPEWLFHQRKKVLFKLSYCPSNERDVKRFIDEIESFTNGKLKFINIMLCHYFDMRLL